MELFFATHAGMTMRDFYASRGDGTPRQSRCLARRFVDLVYRPQLELLGYLRANGFKCFMVTGGGVDFVRAFPKRATAFRREQVIGSSASALRGRAREPQPGQARPSCEHLDDREVKVENIGLHIGRRPILAFGNSDGDLAMLRYTAAGRCAPVAAGPPRRRRARSSPTTANSTSAR